MAKTLQDIQQLIKDKGIRMVDFKLTDIDGRWRHLCVDWKLLRHIICQSITPQRYEIILNYLLKNGKNVFF